MNESHFQILRALEANSHLTQREISRKTGIALGSVNYCLNALAQKGLIKIGNFTRSKKKTSYTYLLTAEGLEQKTKATYHFLKRKLQEYEELKAEIEELKKEVDESSADEELKNPSADSR